MAGQVKITKALALRLLKEAVEKKGADYVDPLSEPASGGCKYAKGTRPGCIVGHALHDVGVKPRVLRELDELRYTAFTGYPFLTPGERNSSAFVVTALAERGVVVTEAAMHVFARAQDRQDMGKSWGEALKAARQA